MRRIVILSLLCASCGQTAPQDRASYVDFIVFGPDVNGLVARAKKPRLTACLGGAVGDQSDWETMIQTAAAKWLAPMSGWTSDPIANQVDVAADGRRDCDFDVWVEPGTWSNTEIGDHPTIHMSNEGYFGSFNVLLHEMGHAFALADTYQGASGDCKRGQPQAVMCNTSFAELQSDDIAGLKKVFENVYPNDRPGNPSGGPKIFMALGGNAQGPDSYQLSVALIDPGPADSNGVMSYCVGSPAECGNPAAGWLNLRKSGVRPGAEVWATRVPINLVDQLALTVRFATDRGAIFQAVRFARQS